MATFKPLVVAAAVAVAWLAAKTDWLIRFVPTAARFELADRSAGPLRLPVWCVAPFFAHSAVVLAISLAPTTLPGRAALLHRLRVVGLRLRVRFIFGAASVVLLFLAAAAWRCEGGGRHDSSLMLLALGMLQAHAYHGVWMNEAGETNAILGLEKEIAGREIVAWKPPPRRNYEVAPPMLHAALQPKFLGADVLPAGNRKVIFVMNHQMGGFEIPLFIEHCHVELDLFPRALADHFHFMVPGWGQVLRDNGAIDGTRENCSLVMGMGQPMLVFPGGGNEILKSRHDEKYALKWKDRAGFARLAMEHGYTIVPVAAVGLEDQFDVLADIPIGGVLAYMGAKGSRAELTLPVMAPNSGNLGQRLYFRFLEPVDTTTMGGPGKAGDNAAVMVVRDLVKDRLEAGLQALLKERELDPERFIVCRQRAASGAIA